MLNIFDQIKVYHTKWEVKEYHKLNDAEKSAIVSATVVDSQYGTSCCFVMKSGAMAFIPMSNTSTKGIGESLDINEIEVVLLSKRGEEDIMRINA